MVPSYSGAPDSTFNTVNTASNDISPEGNFTPLSHSQRLESMPGLLGITMDQVPPQLFQQMYAHPNPMPGSHAAGPNAVEYGAPPAHMQPATGQADMTVQESVTRASYYIATLTACLPTKTTNELVEMFTRHIKYVTDKEEVKKQKCEAGEKGWENYTAPGYDTLERLALARCLAEPQDHTLLIHRIDNPTTLQNALNISNSNQGILLLPNAPYAIFLGKSANLDGSWLTKQHFPDGTTSPVLPLKDMLSHLFHPDLSESTLYLCTQNKDWMPEPNATSVNAQRENLALVHPFKQYFESAKETDEFIKNEPLLKSSPAAKIGQELESFSIWAASRRYDLAKYDTRVLNQLIDHYCDQFPHENSEESLRSKSLNLFVHWKDTSDTQKISQLRKQCAEAMKDLSKTIEELKEKQTPEERARAQEMCIVM